MPRKAINKTADMFFIENVLDKISKEGDDLEKLKVAVDWEGFRPLLDKALARSDGSTGGRPPCDPVLIFKILVLKAMHNMSDAQIARMVVIRADYWRFLGISNVEEMPDEKTIWKYQNELVEAKVYKKLFAQFDKQLCAEGFTASKGQSVDATLVETPRSRMKKEEREQVKAGKVPEEWKPAKRAQMDCDARWTVITKAGKKDENGKKRPGIIKPVIGYKNHVSIDNGSGIIRAYEVSSAAQADIKEFTKVVHKNNSNKDVYADKAYRSAKIEEWLAKKGYRSEVHRKKARGKEMAARTRMANKRKSRIRCKVEHVFAGLKVRFGLYVRTKGKSRAKWQIGMANMAYNMKRYIWLKERRIAASG